MQTILESSSLNIRTLQAPYVKFTLSLFYAVFSEVRHPANASSGTHYTAGLMTGVI